MNLEIYDYWTIVRRKKLEAEPYYSSSLQKVIMESNYFNEAIIDQKRSIQILNQLNYNLNQGQELTQQKMDQLYFQVTKLLQFDSVYLKRITYFTLKLIFNEDNKCILVQNVKNEIESLNQLSKSIAIRLIPHLQDMINPKVMERILGNNIIGQSQLLSSAAILAGLKILQNHPTVISRLSNQLYERLNDKYPFNNFHALLLLYESKKDNQIKLLNQLIKLNLSPIAKMQLIRFVRFQLQSMVENQFYTNEFNQANIHYLLQEVKSSDPLLVLESAKSLSLMEHFSEEAFKLMVNNISPILESHNCNINKYSALSIVKKMINNKREILSTLSSQFINQVENLSYDNINTISSLAIEIINIIHQENFSKQLAKIYKNRKDLQIIEGIYEFIILNPRMADKITEFINLTFEEMNLGQIDMSLQLLEQVFKSFPQDRHKAINLLIRIGRRHMDDKMIKSEVIQIIRRQINGINCVETDFSQILTQLEQEYQLKDEEQINTIEQSEILKSVENTNAEIINSEFKI